MSVSGGKIAPLATVSNTVEQKRSYGTLEPSGETTDQKNPFLDPDVAEYWRTVYEKAQYECRHVFDPALTWPEEEERRLVRKLDWRICLWAVCDMLSSKVCLPELSIRINIST
ncbi:unnamed protein product [Penicillium salamii]|uniref:Uncharacterized protein n=1 Tax=Penicillium salamii TaxID=1612424 RepID=A0A9W4NFE8_9EURO|nr:unnamed protein product [Penicillium salamii]CAG8365635.1 unnamed protein product [Penicillium salamii]CAG8367228.1 unnamed protein product [Penicillium salamii]CAG8406495.1 unnamed protein product [Penicillium salamii]